MGEVFINQSRCQRVPFRTQEGGVATLVAYAFPHFADSRLPVVGNVGLPDRAAGEEPPETLPKLAERRLAGEHTQSQKGRGGRKIGPTNNQPAKEPADTQANTAAVAGG